ncbi:hypothetical protein BO86DRAFT_374117 [Aspergillus japonicus CBS 114.51]|uniref:Uncharacterized protein n=1 Tax=Aspergillus japonicus CBS 114.51 TaxID=1448312 RepID=A0A8T8WJ38_ASPJA|nr:hypothetical protein BO86DRAFT_374117 [Aspergillus japonicus CBS 114.51]RAH75805.1 hypothetical protein BO86DRAFT_374117 [Aspergillus japonicus CBS 114.51]
MSNAAEQLFFYGQVTDPEHASSLDVLTYLDLTNGGTLLFQAIILTTFMMILLPDLAPLTLTGAQRFIISPVRSLLQSIHWVLQQLSSQESRQSFYRLCYENTQDAILKSSLFQLTLVGVLWFFPSNRPLRLSLFYTLCNKVAALRRGAVPAVVDGEPQPTECETYLWNLSKSLESANEQLQQCMATKEAEFQAEKQRLEETVRHQTDLTSRRVESALRQAKNAHAGIIDELRKKVVQLENNLTMARAEAQFVVVDEVDAAREQFLKDRIVQLEKQLAGVKKKSNARNKKELQTVKDELQTRTDELTLVDVEKHLAAAEEHGRESETQRQELLMKNQELLTQNQQISAEYEAFRVTHEANLQHSQSLETLQQERDAALAQNQQIIAEYEAFRFGLDEAHRQLAEAQFSQVNAQQSMQEGDVAGNMSLAEARAQAEQARTQAFMKEKELAEVTEENRTLQIQVGLAMRDAQRGQERADTAERVNKVLEVRLAQWEEKARDEQTILKRPTASVGSVTTVLQQCQVKVSEQQTTINELKEKLEKAKVASPAGKVEEKLRADFSMIKSMYDREKRARTEDQIRWSKENRELEEELRKLRISISNAKTPRPRRRVAGLASDLCDVD